jgi:hypothetical protein
MLQVQLQPSVIAHSSNMTGHSRLSVNDFA